jgi:hypothetical protein
LSEILNFSLSDTLLFACHTHILHIDIEKKLQDGIAKLAQNSENIKKRYANGETCLIDLLDTVRTFFVRFGSIVHKIVPSPHHISILSFPPISLFFSSFFNLKMEMLTMG